MEQPSKDERREPVAYSLPRKLIEAVAMHAITTRSKSKSHAAQDLIERGLEAFKQEERVTA